MTIGEELTDRLEQIINFISANEGKTPSIHSLSFSYPIDYQQKKEKKEEEQKGRQRGGRGDLEIPKSKFTIEYHQYDESLLQKDDFDNLQYYH